MSEIFTYLGRQPQEYGAVHAFMHTQCTAMSSNAILEMTGGLMNALIHEEFIECNDKVLVFNLSVENNSILPTLVDHIDFKPITLPETELPGFLSELLRANRDQNTDLLLVKAIIQNGIAVMYESYILDDKEHIKNITTSIYQMRDTKLPPFDQLETCYTKKPIPYLTEN